MRPFSPKQAGTVSIAISGSSQNVALNAGSGNQVRAYNATGADVFLAFGPSGVTAATGTGLPLPAGGIEIYTILPGTATFAAAVGAGTGNVYFTPGTGL